MSFDELKELLIKLEKRGKTSKADIMIYCVSPFLMSLGYNTFDLDVVDMKQDKGRADVHVLEGMQLVVSLDRSGFRGGERAKIFLRINTGTKHLTLYFHVMGRWEEIVSVNLNNEEDDKYVEITKKIDREQIEMEYSEKGERLLSEVVIDYQLDRGEWDNDFLMHSLMSELGEPSEMFVELMANRLVEEYTTREPEWVEQRLYKMTEEGVLHLIKKALDVKDEVEEKKEEEKQRPSFNGMARPQASKEWERNRVQQEPVNKEEEENTEPEESDEPVWSEPKEQEEIKQVNQEENVVELNEIEDGDVGIGMHTLDITTEGPYTSGGETSVTDITEMVNFGEDDNGQGDIFKEELSLDDELESMREQHVGIERPEMDNETSTEQGSRDYNKEGTTSGSSKIDKIKNLLDFSN